MRAGGERRNDTTTKSQAGPDKCKRKSNQRKPRGRLGRDVQSKIGQQLRAMYDDVVSEGVPDRFTEMLRQLDRGDKNKDQDKGTA